MKYRVVQHFFGASILTFFTSWILPSSELSVQMRKMFDYLKKEKVRIEKNHKPQPFPEYFNQIENLAHTPSKTLSTKHHDYSLALQQTLNDYYLAKEPSERLKTYNLLVSKCITCHEEECPGPVIYIQEQFLR